MKCNEALAILQTVNDGAEARVSGSALQGLVSSGLLAPAPGAGDDAGLERVRSRLLEIASAKEASLAAMREIESHYPGMPPAKIAGQAPEHGSNRQKLAELEAEERSLRTDFLDRLHRSAGARAGATINGQRVCLTYRGHELLGELVERQERVGGMEVDGLLAELEALKRHFGHMAARSAGILKTISPAFCDLEEIHLRMASVGLAARPGDPAEAAGLFIQAYLDISDALNWPDPVGVTLAENLVLRSSDAGELGGLLGSFRALMGLTPDLPMELEERVRSLAIVLSPGGDSETLYRQGWEVAQNGVPERPSAAAFLVATGQASPGAPGGAAGGVPQSFLQLREWMADWGLEPPAAALPAAIMAAGPYPPAVAWERFGRALGALSRFNGGGMEVPSAMLAVLPLGIDESLDNLRLASAAIVQHRLSLGGAENLSLGIKLLMESSLLAASPGGAGAVGAPPVLAMAGMAPAAALPMGAGLAAFHETSVHRMVWRDYRFHPVHHHYIYG